MAKKIKMILILIFLSSCILTFPEKPFITELWQISTKDMTIKRLNEDAMIDSIPIRDLNEEWVVVRLEHILGEWEYQETLKRYCESFLKADK